VAQAVKHLFCKCEAMSSNLSPTPHQKKSRLSFKRDLEMFMYYSNAELSKYGGMNQALYAHMNNKRKMKKKK
jgi:hypothetical protein